MGHDLIVIAAHGPDWLAQCRESLREHAPGADVLAIATDGSLEHGADVALRGGHPTAAYRWAHEQYAAYDGFLFVQDSMTAVADPLSWFREQMPADGLGAVAWGRFPQQWDGEDQKQWVERQYPGVREPSHGVFGPVFYTSRTTLDVLTHRNLMPAVPASRYEAQGTERAWAYALAAAGLPLHGPGWDPEAMRSPEGFGPFRKIFAGRP